MFQPIGTQNVAFVRGIVGFEIPELPGLLSETGNRIHTRYRAQTFMQSMLAAHGMLAKSPGANKDTLAARLHRKNKKLSLSYCKAIVEFVEIYSGGADGKFLTALELFAKHLPVRREIDLRFDVAKR